MVDIPGNNSTTTTISVGGTLQDSLEFAGDHDWVRINLTHGQEITVFLEAITSSLDPYLRILNSSGAVIWENDDINPGVNLDSLISFAANLTNPNVAGYNPSGVFYIDVGSFDSPNNAGETGTYRLSVTNYVDPPVWTNDQIATQLVSGYWGGAAEAHRFNVSPGGSITVNLTALNNDGRELALAALQTWTDIIGVNFVAVTTGGQIVFDDIDEDGAYTDTDWTGPFITSSFVNVDRLWLDEYGAEIGDYSFHAYVHEIGHALGLGHAGNYNTTAEYPYQALFANDGWPATVMSYFHQAESEYWSNQGFQRANVVTPMVADIIAMQQMYGLSTNTRLGDTTYGYNSNAGTVYSATSPVAFTIYDSGGNDTLDYSQSQNALWLNLNPETYSTVNQRVGSMSIARGTIIENAIGSTRQDTLIGNSVANVLIGGGNRDTLTGGAGNDTFQGLMSELNTDIITDFSMGDRIVFTDATLGSFSYNLSGSTLNFTGGSLTLQAPVAGTIVASAAAGGGVQLVVQPSYDALHDFNGDGRSDILLRNDNGSVTDWLGQPNGGFFSNHAVAAYGLATSWHVNTVGDFNGDGRDDVLLRNDNGSVTNWLGQSNGNFFSNHVNTSYTLPAGWNVEGAGDFNGDGRDDVLLRNDNGTITEWLGQPDGSFFSNHALVAYGLATSWHVDAIGDFNGDGRDDLLLRNNNGSVTNWLGQADGSFFSNHANASYALPADWHVEGAGDFNGDGRDDLLLRNDNGTITEWLGQANGSFFSNHAVVAYGLATSWHVDAIGDFNGDGRDDLLLRNNNGSVIDWLGAPNGSFFSNHANASYVLPQGWHVQSDGLWM